MKLIIISAIGITPLLANMAFAESFESLRSRVDFQKMTVAVQNGSNNAFALLPAKGYKNGLSGILRKYNVYPNPAYSFTSCGPTDVITASGGKPGCVVSLKIAKKLPNGVFQDTGIRIEYAIELGAARFSANNSAYAQHAISGSGWLESQLIN